MPFCQYSPAMKTTLALLALFGTAAMAAMQTSPAGVIRIATLSTAPSRITGGDVLVQVVLPDEVAPASLKVTAGGRDVSGAFRRKGESRVMEGVVTGLPLGNSAIEAVADRGRGRLDVTNYPATGPVISGPWQQPFLCQTDAFKLPDGTTLGPPIDANCSARTVVQYVYKSTTTPKDAPGADDPRDATARRALPPWYTPLADPSRLPADVATTTTTSGVIVPFIVRVETGTMNRGIYQNAILFDPTTDQAPTPFAPPRGWNRKLLAVHGSGCPSGWYIQGAALGVSVLADESRLAQGYAVFNNTLNHPTNSCNAFLAGETTMMGKEHFIETFGVPRYTISYGGSGGAYTSLQVADAFPGLIDGVEIRATFPDALAIAMSGSDAHLLTHYFATTNPGGFTEAQQVAVSGYHGMKAFIDAANQSQRTDPVQNRADIEGYQAARWNAAVPAAMHYDATKNPSGARPTVFDAAKNVYGVNPATGAALRPFDNVGVQYGLDALNSGAITVRQFLDLNERVGGLDQDANYASARSVGDAGAIRRAYQAGLMLGANGGLTSIPIFDNATSNETGGYHYGWFHFALRERLRKANGGSSDSMAMWRAVSGSRGRELFDQWMDAIAADTSNGPARAKMVRNRPKALVDGCYDSSTPPVFIADALPFTSKPVSKCSELYPVYSSPRLVAGGPLAADALKCQVKPVGANDYKVPLTAAELAKLKAIFPGGVCDWTRAGVEQTPVVPWASFGPSPVNQVYEPARAAGGSR